MLARIIVVTTLPVPKAAFGGPGNMYEVYGTSVSIRYYQALYKYHTTSVKLQCLKTSESMFQ